MAAPSVNELDGLLASLNQLKPPGASKTKISTITTLCVNNVQAESSIVQSFYRALKKAPPTHKLGALYVIDSVVRQWIEKSKTSGQDLHIEGRGEPGTYPAAVKRVTELMPALFDDIFKSMPAEQKPKLENMVTIWERGSTFPAKMLAEFKTRLTGSANGVSPAPVIQSTKASGEKFRALKPTRPVSSPVGYPPPQLYERGLIPGKTAPPQTNGASTMPSQPASTQPSHPPASHPAPSTHVNDILAALSRAVPAAPPASFPPHVQQSTPSAAAPPQQLPPELAAFFAQQTQAGGQPAAPAPQAPQQVSYNYPGPAPQAANPAFQMPTSFSGYPQPPPSVPQAYAVAPPPSHSYSAPPPQQDPLAPLRGLLPENILNDQQKLIPALQLLQELQKDGIPSDRWGPVLKAFEEQYQPPTPAYPSHNGHAGGRGRSRSPERGSGYRGRSPNVNSYDTSGARGRADDGRSRFRQRSPMRSTSGNVAMNGMPMQPKMIEIDYSLPPDNIKVLSRTLFVGGANGTQNEIQELFERFGKVQTCIANRDKRHAFVKMTTRSYALAAKAGMEDMQARNDREVMSIARQTKWGVGFGPRECCDYARGESVIPIHKLTDADMKWLLTAEYGGTGGDPVKGGMVLEEPDIEIGAGVSSKAMSKRVGPDSGSKRHREGKSDRHNRSKGGDHGYSGGGSGGGGGGGGYGAVNGGQQGLDPYAYARPEPVAVATPPAVPGFGFSSLNLPQNTGQNAYR